MKSNRFFVLIALLMILLSSCELAYQDKYQAGTIWFVGYAADYGSGISYESIEGKSGTLQHLDQTINEVEELNKAFEALSEKANIPYKSILCINESFDKYKKNLEEGLKPDKNDIIIFTFSCHGDGIGYDPEEVSKEVPYGSEKAFSENLICFYSKDPIPNVERVHYNDLYKYVEEEFDCTKLFIYDVCFSGGAVVSDGVTVNKDVYNNVGWYSTLFNKNINQSKYKSSIWTLSSATFFQKAYEDRELNSHGAFTLCLFEALGWDYNKHELGTINALSGNVLSAGSIARYIYGKAWKNNYKDFNQNPVFSAGSSDIILFKF